MKQKFLSLQMLMLILATALLASSCSEEEEDNTSGSTPYAYILNSGSFKKNNATLSGYNPQDTTVTTNYFERQNGGANLGDTGQSLFIFGNKMYIGMYGSKCIYVTDLTGKLISTISQAEGLTTISPRSFTSDDNYVYVSLFEGYLARINPTTDTIDKTIYVGSNPEGVAIAHNKIYVSISNGMQYPNYDNKVRVVDPNSFSTIDSIVVRVNPGPMASDGNDNLFVISLGNYDSIKGLLQRINEDHTVDSIANATMMAIGHDKKSLYFVYSPYGGSEKVFGIYDVTNKNVSSSQFLSSSQSDNITSSPYSLSANPYNETLYLFTSNYSSEGTMYEITPSKQSINKSIRTGGINPMGIYFFRK